jgi:hypothetical protein
MPTDTTACMTAVPWKRPSLLQPRLAETGRGPPIRVSPDRLRGPRIIDAGAGKFPSVRILLPSQ